MNDKPELLVKIRKHLESKKMLDVPFDNDKEVLELLNRLSETQVRNLLVDFGTDEDRREVFDVLFDEQYRQEIKREADAFIKGLMNRT